MTTPGHVDDAFLRTLDRGAQTVEDLAHACGLDTAAVEARLHEGQEAGLVASWGDVYVTTWRAKWRLHRRAMQRALAASAAVALGVTALALARAPHEDAPLAAGACAVTSVLAGAASWALRGRGDGGSATP